MIFVHNLAKYIRFESIGPIKVKWVFLSHARVNQRMQIEERKSETINVDSYR